MSNTKTKSVRNENVLAPAVLQESLTDLLGLSLFAKQIHWNVVGSGFRDLHLMLDEMNTEYNEWVDTVAERIRAIGAAPDGRPQAVAQANGDALTDGAIPSDDATRWLVNRVGHSTGRFDGRLERLGDDDLVSQDLLIEIKGGLDKQLWMLRAIQS